MYLQNKTNDDKTLRLIKYLCEKTGGVFALFLSGNGRTHVLQVKWYYKFTYIADRARPLWVVKHFTNSSITYIDQ